MTIEYQTITEEKLSENSWSTLAKLIDANKLTGWTIRASYPRDNDSLPCIVVENPIATIIPKTTDTSVKKIEIEANFKVYDKLKNGTKIIDYGKDNIRHTIIGNFTTLRTYGLMYESIQDGDISPTEDEQMNEGELKVMFTKIN